MVKKYNLQELVEYKKNLNTQVETGEAPEEIEELAVLAEALLKGKVDQAARFKAGLEAHIKAAQENLASLNEMLERTEELMEEAVMSTPDKRLEGTTYTLRMQNNSRASVVIDDPEKIHHGFYRCNLSTTFDYTLDTLCFYAGVLLKRVVATKDGANPMEQLDITPVEKAEIEKCVSTALSKKDLEVALKSGEVTGARLERGQHLRVEAGKSKARLLKQTVEVEGV
jgi:hypothetical protein